MPTSFAGLPYTVLQVNQTQQYVVWAGGREICFINPTAMQHFLASLPQPA